MGNNIPQLTGQTNHALYGETKEFNVTNGEKTHLVLFAVNEENDGKTFIGRYKAVAENFSKQHLLLSNNFSMENLFLCGKSKCFSCVFPYYPYSLEQEIERRSNQKRFLSKEELTYLIYQIIDGARNFDRIDEKVGDIRPSQILLNQSKKKVKLVNYFTSPNQFTGLQKAVELKEKAYLAPQQLKAFQKNNPNPQINVHKADSFSLGLTILAIGNLKRIHDELYDWKDCSFSWTQLSNEMETFQNRYGQFLGEIVKGLVHNEPRNRLYIGEVGALLQFYERQIIELVSFEPDFSLLEKNYELNYSGPRSQGFIRWFTVIRQIYVKKVIVLQPPIVQPVIGKVIQPVIERKVIHHVQPVVEKKIIQVQPIVEKKVIQVVEKKMLNSRIRFSYTSPGLN